MIKLKYPPPPPPNVPESDISNDSKQDSFSNDSYIPYSLRNSKFTPYSTNTTKKHKKKENKIDDKLKLAPPLTPAHPDLIPPMLHPNMIYPLTTTTNIHWEMGPPP